MPIKNHLDMSRPSGAVAIIYEFDQHNDTYYQYLGSIGSPEPLAVKSENSGLGKTAIKVVPK